MEGSIPSQAMFNDIHQHVRIQLEARGNDYASSSTYGDEITLRVVQVLWPWTVEA